MLLSLLLLVSPAAVVAETSGNGKNNTNITSSPAQATRLDVLTLPHPQPKGNKPKVSAPHKSHKPETISSSRRKRPPLPPPKPGRTSKTTPLPTTTSKQELPTCKKERICDSKRNSEEFRELVVALHKELRRELEVDTWHFSDEGELKELDLEYNCTLEKLAYQRIQNCRKSLYSSKTHNSAVVRRHLGQEKVLAFLKAFSYWRNGKEKRSKEDFEPHTEYDKLSWDTLSAIGCAVKQCKKRGERFTLVDCKYDYKTYANVLVPG